MMSRTQITLDPEAHREARRRAAEQGLSLAAYIRLLVRRDLDEPVRAASDVSGMIGLADSGGSDIARHKDDYLGDAIAAEHRRSVDRPAR